MGRWIGVGLLAGIGILFASEYSAYCLTYSRTRQHPDAGVHGWPTAYYLDWRSDWSDLGKLRRAAREGVLETPRALRIEGELIPDPIGVIQGGLAIHDQLLDDPDQPERVRILRDQLEWLHASAIWLPGRIPVWPCYWRAGEYGLEGPWISAMTQGQAISLLVRGARFFDEPRHLELAGRAVASLRTDDLPITRRTPEGAVFFEEFPSSPPSGVLNGALCAWLGVWDYWRATDDPLARELAERTIASLESIVPAYEMGDWTRYDLIKSRPVSPTYQEIHASLAETVSAITGMPEWADRADRWRRAADRPLLRGRVFFKVLWAKSQRRVFGGDLRVRPEPMPAGLERRGQSETDRAVF